METEAFEKTVTGDGLGFPRLYSYFLHVKYIYKELELS